MSFLPLYTWQEAVRCELLEVEYILDSGGLLGICTYLLDRREACLFLKEAARKAEYAADN